jgi:DinB superfamily
MPMPRESLTIEHVLTLLAETPPRIFAITADLTSDQLQAIPGPDEWSANDVLAHLRSCADVWGGCIRTMLDQDAPTLRAVSPRAWIKTTNYRDQQFRRSFRAFAAQRADLLTVLEPLTPKAWSRTATVKGAGKVLTQTVLSYAERLAVHERKHLEQFARIANTLLA